MKSLMIGAVVLLAVAMMAIAANAGGRPLNTTLTGAAEVPGPGDPDGSGAATLTLNPGQGELCFELSVSEVSPATAAHVHRGNVGAAGPPVVTFVAPAGGASSGCVAVDRNRIKAIMKNPELYYVNVHNVDFPAGALRGQLSK